MTKEIEELRLRELTHRCRNMLAITRAIVQQTLRGAASIEEAQRLIDSRLASYGGTLDLLLETDWEPMSLAALAGLALSHFSIFAERIVIEQSHVEIGGDAALTLALVLHELATNAIKYGALSNEAGRVELTWRTIESGDSPEIWIQWAERDGPPVSRPPQRQGLGTRLICTSAARSLRGRADLDFLESGVVWTLIAPLASLDR